MENYQNSRMDTENELYNAREHMEKLLNLSECGLVIARMQTEPELLYANDYFYQSLQYTREEYHEKFGNAVMGPVLQEEKQKIKALIARQTTFGGTIHLEFPVAKKDGSVMWISFTAKRDSSLGPMIFDCSLLDVTASKRSLDEVYRAKRELDLMANSIPGGVIKLRMSDFLLLYANDGFFRLAGYTRTEYSLKFQNCCAGPIHPDDVDMVNRLVKQSIENRGPLGMEYRIIAKNGEVRWSYVNGTRVDDDQGEAVYLCVIVDITSRKMAEEELADNNRRADIIATMMKETMWTYNISKATLSRGGDLGGSYSPETLLQEQFSDEQIVNIIHPEDVETFIKMRDNWFRRVGDHQGVVRMINSNGIYRPMEVRTSSEAGEDGKPEKIYGVTRLLPEKDTVTATEVSQQSGVSELSGKLVKMAGSMQANTADTITGLLPYAAFLRKAEHLLANRKESDHYALICADINEFRSFSHHYGFYISNQVLKMFSDVLLQNFAMDGLCARVDGDYFVVLFQYHDHKELVKAMSAVVRSQEEMEKEDTIEFGSTVGVYLVQEEDHELLDMLQKADLARRSIKGLQGNHYAIYTEDVAKQLSKEDEMINDIRKAMDENAVEINYLPRIKEDKEHVVGCKALPRILLRSGQYVEYKQIMHLMERGAQLEEFSFYLLREVANNVGAWKAKGSKVIPVSVEMTASQLSTKHAVERIHKMVTRNHLEPKDFIFEVPERFFSDATTAFEVAICELHSLGYQVVISRFGADHTAVNSVRRLPVSGIKFHGEYFNEHMINEKDTVVLTKSVEMAQELGLSVSCGGIHTRLQEDYARKIGCHVFEGDIYYGAVKNVVFEKCFLKD